MNNKDFEEYMKTFLIETNQVPDEMFIVLKLKLRQFTPIIKIFKNPFSYDYRNMMCATAEALLTEFNGLYAEMHKDEISILLPKSYTQFSRRTYQLHTLAASTASSVFSLQYGEKVQFDAEVYGFYFEDSLYDYFRWRQADAERFAIFTHAVTNYKRIKKISIEKAEKALKGRSTNNLWQWLVNTANVNLNSSTPLWHRRGSVLFWRLYFKSGIDPITGRENVVTRRRPFICHRVPGGDDYSAFIYRKALFGTYEANDVATIIR